MKTIAITVPQLRKLRFVRVVGGMAIRSWTLNTIPPRRLTIRLTSLGAGRFEAEAWSAPLSQDGRRTRTTVDDRYRRRLVSSIQQLRAFFKIVDAANFRAKR